jgi:hypothetical protein
MKNCEKRENFLGSGEEMLWLPMGEEQEHVDWSQQGALSVEAHIRGETKMERNGLNQEEAEQAKGIRGKEAAARELALWIEREGRRFALRKATGRCKEMSSHTRGGTATAYCYRKI